MIVRLASPHDAKAVISLIRRTPVLPQWPREALALEPPVDEASIGPVRRLLVAIDGDRLIGFAQIAVLLGEAELESMAVEAERRGQGVGRRLLAEAIGKARELGATVFRLEARRGNAAALRLYESAGMRVTGERRGYYTGPPEDALFLELSCGRQTP